MRPEWTDDEGRPLGEWIEVNEAEWRDLFYAAGGWDDLTVLLSLTDPEGVYGPAQIYTAWGRRGAAVPLLDIRDYKAEDGSTETQIRRRFAVTTRPSEEAKDAA